MDNQPAAPPVATFVPDRRYTLLAAIAAAIAVLVAIFTQDREGRLLAAGATLVLASYAASDLIFSPRLVASIDGLVVRSPLTRARLPWAQIESVRADTRSRLGLRSTTLEIDAGEVLAVLSRRALGDDPERVAALVSAFRPRP